MKVLLIPFIICSWISLFLLGVQYGKAQIVKEALSKIPHGKIDLRIKENMDKFIKDWER